MSFNKIILVGNLGKDVELRYTANGMAVANFSVATTEGNKDANGEWQNTTTWFKCTAWGKQAESCNKNLEKGTKVYLEGRLSEEKWKDKDGNDRTTLTVKVSDVQFLEKRDTALAASAGEGSTGDFSGTTEVSTEDELPF